MMGHQGGGGGGKPKPKRPPGRAQLSPGLKAELNAIDRHEQYLRHCRIGLEALPVFQEEYSDLKHFGLDVEMKQIGIYEVPVLANGWHVMVSDC